LICSRPFATWPRSSRQHGCKASSLLPLVRGETTKISDAIFAEVTFHAAYEPKRAVRTERYKYIRNYDNRNRPNLPNCDDSASKDALLALGWRDQPVPAEQLFDLAFDPNETTV
jgi:hypothetical protein